MLINMDQNARIERREVPANTAKQYNNRGDELCNPPVGHEFENGLCVHCVAPETAEDADAAIREFYERESERLEARR